VTTTAVDLDLSTTPQPHSAEEWVRFKGMPVQYRTGDRPAHDWVKNCKLLDAYGDKAVIERPHHKGNCLVSLNDIRLDRKGIHQLQERQNKREAEAPTKAPAKAQAEEETDGEDAGAVPEGQRYVLYSPTTGGFYGGDLGNRTARMTLERAIRFKTKESAYQVRCRAASGRGHVPRELVEHPIMYFTVDEAREMLADRDGTGSVVAATAAPATAPDREPEEIVLIPPQPPFAAPAPTPATKSPEAPMTTAHAAVEPTGVADALLEAMEAMKAAARDEASAEKMVREASEMLAAARAARITAGTKLKQLLA
jgi:hypothetical protein